MKVSLEEFDQLMNKKISEPDFRRRFEALHSVCIKKKLTKKEQEYLMLGFYVTFQREVLESEFPSSFLQ